MVEYFYVKFGGRRFLRYRENKQTNTQTPVKTLPPSALVMMMMMLFRVLEKIVQPIVTSVHVVLFTHFSFGRIV